MRILAKNLTAQLLHPARGNPPSVLADSAISNCYPGLEFDFRNAWRRLFVGIELHEADNLVVHTEPRFKDLLHCRLLRVDGHPMIVSAVGPREQGQGAVDLGLEVAMEWSNSLAEVFHRYAGRRKGVRCEFSTGGDSQPVGLDAPVQVARLRVRSLFTQDSQGRPIPVLDPEAVLPGELTQSLCSPWQNDYRECACYYWASSRPDFVNVAVDDAGRSVGMNWLSLKREPNRYVVDSNDPSLATYEDLFRRWQSILQFVIGGNDAD